MRGETDRGQDGILSPGYERHNGATTALAMIIATVSLASGGLMYILFRKQSHRVLAWCDNAGLGGAVRPLRHMALRHVSLLPGWCVYSLPDGLWLFSLLMVIAAIWRRDRATATVAQAMLTAAALGHEVAQARWPKLGTCSAGDLVCYLAAATLAYAAGVSRIEVRR